MAHRIVWASAATVDAQGRPWTRVLHPIWLWDGERLTGWIATGPTPTKQAHLAAHPYVSLTYWDPSHDTASAQCRASLHTDDETRTQLWDRFRSAPEPVGYDPAIIPGWDGPLSPGFAALRLDPWRLHVQPAAVLLEGKNDQAMVWREAVSR
ncbi:pyridoxamine 5'-phosphate oxidase family protein [Pseudonocardia xinjiangensis]|uniref:Pyridoxamine 5'-phosphate oxidase family protein n=2 Tax=Pseudonocardia xinjiangensis TaxID=75289 RepID=A0ABX1RIS0_9PSEU|nr:pyridoxamine 5'-phosphate oxidase family protein [Pseudonocardia xinjiangensis]